MRPATEAWARSHIATTWLKKAAIGSSEHPYRVNTPEEVYELYAQGMKVKASEGFAKDGGKEIPDMIAPPDVMGAGYRVETLTEIKRAMDAGWKQTLDPFRI